MFVRGYRFVNPQHNPDCPARGVSFCTTRQGGGNVENNIASTEGEITALGGANVRNKEVTSVTRMKLAVVVGPLTTAPEMGIHSYVLHSLLRGVSPVVEAILPLFNWIDQNWTDWVCLMAKQETTAWFAYDVSWILSTYLNACILASMALAEGGPGARTPVLFQYPIDEIHHCRYTGREIPRSLKDILTVCVGRRAALASAAALPPPKARTIGRDG